jgi:hypothetical protein
MTLIGTACIVGIDGTVAWGSITTAMNKLQSSSLSRSHPQVDITDGNQNIVARAYAGPQDTFDIEYIPISAAGTPTKSDAGANSTLPTPGATVTIASTLITALNGTWNYDGKGSIEQSTNGPTKVKLTLVRLGAADGSGNPTSYAVVS